MKNRIAQLLILCSAFAAIMQTGCQPDKEKAVPPRLASRITEEKNKHGIESSWQLYCPAFNRLTITRKQYAVHLANTVSVFKTIYQSESQSIADNHDLFQSIVTELEMAQIYAPSIEVELLITLSNAIRNQDSSLYADFLSKHNRIPFQQISFRFDIPQWYKPTDDQETPKSLVAITDPYWNGVYQQILSDTSWIHPAFQNNIPDDLDNIRLIQILNYTMDSYSSMQNDVENIYDLSFCQVDIGIYNCIASNIAETFHMYNVNEVLHGHSETDWDSHRLLYLSPFLSLVGKTFYTPKLKEKKLSPDRFTSLFMSWHHRNVNWEDLLQDRNFDFLDKADTKDNEYFQNIDRKFSELLNETTAQEMVSSFHDHLIPTESDEDSTLFEFSLTYPKIQFERNRMGGIENIYLVPG